MAKRARQLSFDGDGLDKPHSSFGGSLLKGNPKKKRPLDSKLPILLTMRCEKSVLRLPKTFSLVDDCVYDIAKKHGVRVYKYSNVGNHLHILIKIPHVRRWAAFIRELSGRIAQLLMEKLSWVGGLSFWRFRPHTRIVGGWKKAFRIARGYVELNQLEAEGFISRKDTRNLRDLRAIFDG